MTHEAMHKTETQSTRYRNSAFTHYHGNKVYMYIDGMRHNFIYA